MASETIYPAGRASPVSSGMAWPFLTDGSESLRVSFRGRGLGIVGLVTGRVWHRDSGRIEVFSQRPTTVQSAILVQDDYPLPAGALLNLRLTTDPGVKYGAVFGSAQLVRGSNPSASTVIATIAQGYTNTTNERAFPGSPIQSFGDGPGLIIDPAWGAFAAPLRLEVQSGNFERWRALSGLGQLITSGVAGVRTVYTRATNGFGQLIWQGTGGVAHGPGATVGYSFGAGVAPSGITGGGVAMLPWPADLDLDPGSVITMGVDNAQLGDIVVPFGLNVRFWFSD